MLEGAPMIGSLMVVWGDPAEGRWAFLCAWWPPIEGCRGWFGGLALSAHLSGSGTCDAAYEYLNWWLDGGPGAILARNGAYLANHSAVRAES